MNPNPSPGTHRLAVCAIVALIALLMLPNLAWLCFAHDARAWIGAIVMPVILLLTFFAIFGNRLWLACLLLVPFAVLVPLETFYVATYHRPTFAEVIATIVASNPRESIEYLGNALLPVLISVLAALLVALLAVWWSRRAELRWTHRSRAFVLLIVIATPLISAILAAVIAPGNIAIRLQKGMKPLAILATPIRDGYPFGLIQRFADFFGEWSSMRDTAAGLDAFRFHTHRLKDIGKRQIYVLVIGESSRRDHWQLFGYDRATNPELLRTPNLVPIPDFVSSWPTSITAIPMVVTRKPANSPSRGMWNEASILRAMQEAGFETWWISNQLPIGKYDSPIAIYAFEAEHKIYLNHASLEVAGSYDELLLQPLRNAIHGSNHDLFIVLHMMGSHLNYDLRYPPSFEHFRPTFSEQDPNTAQGERIRNSYDNSVLYSDHILASVIGILRDSGAISALWFESDHGETLPTPTCSEMGHDFGTRPEFEIAALFWYSDAYASTFPERVSSVRANADKRTMSQNTFESLIDMANLDYPQRDATLSLLSPQWQYRPRIVHGVTMTDYDTSTTGSGCGLVLPGK